MGDHVMLLQLRYARAQGAADDFLQGLPFEVELDFAALDARHVEQVRHQRAHTQRFVVQVLRRLQLDRIELGARARERLGQANQRRQWRAQVVRQGRQQRVTQPLGLHAHQRALRDFDVVHAFERDRGQRGEGVELLALFGDQDPALQLGFDREHAARAHRRHQGQVEDLAGRERVGAQARRLGMVERPLRDADVDFGAAAGAIGQPQPALVIGHQQARARAERALHDLARGFEHLLGQRASGAGT